MASAAGPQPYLFATVGTTSFDELVRVALSAEFAAAAAAQGCTRVLVQLGRGTEPAALAPPSVVVQASPAGPGGSGDSTATTWSCVHRGVPTSTGGTPTVTDVTVSCYRFKPNIASDVAGAAIVVSHAGAGSIFESLRAGRPLLVCINTALADNHQLELAHAMAGRGHLLHGEPGDMVRLLAGMDVRALRPLPPLDRRGFLRALREVTTAAP